jgi:hypothetical protein
MMKLSVYAADMNSGKIRTVESRKLRPALVHATRRANDQRLHKSELMAMPRTYGRFDLAQCWSAGDK